MEKTQLMETAQLLFLQGSGRKTVIELFTNNGFASEEANTMATEAYRAVKDERMAQVETTHEDEATSGGSSIGSLLLGLVIMGGGIIATMTTDRIWYGAIFVGFITIISGLVKSFK